MHYSHKTKHQVLSGVLALILSLSLLLPTIPTVWADEAADPETVIESVTDQLAAAGETTTPVTESEPAAAPAASFQSTDGGADVIALTENGHFLAKLPLPEGVTVTENDLASIVWSMDKDETQSYVSEEQYPNQTKGGELSTWQTSKKTPLFTVESCTLAEENGTTYLCLSFSSACYWGSDPSAPHSNGGSYLDVCGYFNLTAKLGETALGSAAVKIVPYDSFHTMQEIYEDLDNMVTYAADNTNLYVKKFSMGTSSGAIYEPLDMPYMILAKNAQAVSEWLAFCDKAETDPTGTLKDIAAGKYDDLKVPVMYSNIHPNEVAATDGVMAFAWMLIESAAADGKLDYTKLTGFTDEGKAELAAEMGPVGAAGSTAVPDLVKDTATYLGYLTAGNRGSGVIDLDKYYTSEDVSLTVDELLDDVFFILVPEENVEGRTYVTRHPSGGYDLNRDNSFQTTAETQNMQHLIATFNPTLLAEFHGRIKGFQVEPCDPPHEPNFEYDLLAKHLLSAGEALGIAAVANNDGYNSYVTPQRDYLYYTGNKTADGADETYWEPWDDMSTSYTPQFAMLQGTIAFTVELPAYNDDTVQAVQYGCLGQSVYVAGEKNSILTCQVQIYERGVTNANSDSHDMVGQWLCNQYDVEGAEAGLFRPEYTGEGENGNFYPECYIIPLDGANQSNLQAAYDMMTWLSRNDVKILVTEQPVTVDGVTYPAGTMVISMYQAKRSVANGALYDGTFITDWTDLYSEGITSFAATRGFDMVTVAKPAVYQTVSAACGSWMGYDDCKLYVAANKGTYFTGKHGADVVISNASENSTAAVNALLQAGKTVGMVTDAQSGFYGDFICSYADFLTVADKFTVSATGISQKDAGYPAATTISKAPVVYITGAAGKNSSGFVYTSQVSSAANWNYDRCAMELMGFETTTDLSAATGIIGASRPNADALAAIQSGTPYIGYGSNSSTVAKLIGAARSSASGMDCLGFVTYPTTTLVNASYVVDGDDILYGYGLGWFSEIPEGAQVLVQMDGSKTPTEGFIKANTDSGKEKMNAYLDNSVQAIQYQGADTEGNQVNVVLFANSLTNKVHQRDEYAFISNFLFSSVLSSEAYVPTEAASYTLSYSVDGAQAPADAASYEEDDTVTLAAAPEKGGYTFTGWTIGEQTFEAGAQIVLDSSLTAQADENGVITVTAQFSQNPVEPVTPDQPADPAQPGASTGDHSQMTVWISLAVLCGAGAAAAVIGGKKKKA